MVSGFEDRRLNSHTSSIAGGSALSSRLYQLASLAAKPGKKSGFNLQFATIRSPLIPEG